MILAGGMSTRLYPLTRTVPKPLVPVAGIPITAHILRYLRSFGYDEIAINVHYLSEMIEARLGDGSEFGVKLHYLHEEQLSGSAGAVKSMESFFNEPFVVVGCDDLTNFDLGALTRFHRERKAIATIGLVEAEIVDQYGVVIVDEDGRIVDFQEKPARGTERSHFVNTGIYAFDPAIFERIPAGTFYDFGKQVFPGLQGENAPFYGLLDKSAYWADIGTPDEYRRATRDVLEERIALPATRVRGVPADATVAPDASVADDVRVGHGAVIEAGARIIGPSVIGDRVRIGEGAKIKASVLWDGASVDAGVSLYDTIVGMDYHVARGETLRGAVVANEPVATPAS
jgi:NDP-sugar pyrophosphorylase family protein